MDFIPVSMNSSVCTAKSDSLRSLEKLMVEFFHDATSNERKRQIEQLLNCFAQESGSWRLCLSYLHETQNHYTIMFCLSCLEKAISNKSDLGDSERSKLRLFIWNYLVVGHRSVPHFVRTKAAKLLISIARIDWPHNYPDLIPNIIEMIQNWETMSSGLMILQTVIEELNVQGDDISSARKEELNNLLLVQIPHVIASLSNLMEMILDKHVNFLTATPPPSPTHTPKYDNNCFGKGWYRLKCQDPSLPLPTPSYTHIEQSMR